MQQNANVFMKENVAKKAFLILWCFSRGQQADPVSFPADAVRAHRDVSTRDGQQDARPARDGAGLLAVSEPAATVDNAPTAATHSARSLRDEHELHGSR